MIRTIPAKPRRAVKVVSPIQSAPVVHYRDLSDLDHLITSKAGYFWCYNPPGRPAAQGAIAGPQILPPMLRDFAKRRKGVETIEEQDLVVAPDH